MEGQVDTVEYGAAQRGARAPLRYIIIHILACLL